MRIAGDIRRGEDGFTLVELLTAISISLIVLFATLQSLDAFTSNAAQQTRRTDANDQVRLTMDRVTRDLRGAAQIVRANPTDLVYTVPKILPDGTQGLRTERLCVDSGALYSSTVAPAPAACSGTKVTTLRSTSATAFTYDGNPTSATPALVRNVGLSFGLDGGGTRATSTLIASAARRSAGILNLKDSDLNRTCGSGGVPRLDLAASIPGVGNELKVVYSDDGGITYQTPLSGNEHTVPPGVTRVIARVTDGLGLTKTIEKDVECDS